MSLTEETWDTLLAGADESGDLGRKAAYHVAHLSCLADEIAETDLIVSPGRTVIDWDDIGKRYGYLGSGATVLRDLCASLDRSAETVSMRGLWNLDLRQRAFVLDCLSTFLLNG